MKKIVVLLITVVLGVMLCNNQTKAKENECVIKGNTLVKYSGDASKYTVPANVKKIKKGAFKDADNLKKIVITKNVCNISNEAFYNAKKLESIIVTKKNKKYKSYDGALYKKKGTELIKIPSNKKTVKLLKDTGKCYATAFEGSKLTSIKLGKNCVVQDDDYNGILQLRYLKEIKVHSDNPYYTSLDGVLYTKDMFRLLRYPAAKDAVNIYEVPDGVCAIAKGAFVSADINEIVMPESMIKIGEHIVYSSKVNNIIFKGNGKCLDYDIWAGFFWGYGNTITFMDDNVILPAYYILSGWLGGNDFTICARTNSAGHKYAMDNNIKYIELK